MAQRGRPRKIEVPEEQKPISWVIAEVMHDECGIPGCKPSMHLVGAIEIIGRLHDLGYEIRSEK